MGEQIRVNSYVAIRKTFVFKNNDAVSIVRALNQFAYIDMNSVWTVVIAKWVFEFDGDCFSCWWLFVYVFDY